MKLPIASPLLLSVALAAGCATADPEPEADLPFDGLPHEWIEGEAMVTVLPEGAIPAIDEPRFLSAEEAAGFFAEDEPVLGVVGPDGTAKAYSAWHLDGHEIVNDEVDGLPIAATW